MFPATERRRALSKPSQSIENMNAVGTTSCRTSKDPGRTSNVANVATIASGAAQSPGGRSGYARDAIAGPKRQRPARSDTWTRQRWTDVRQKWRTAQSRSGWPPPQVPTTRSCGARRCLYTQRGCDVCSRDESHQRERAERFERRAVRRFVPRQVDLDTRIEPSWHFPTMSGRTTANRRELASRQRCSCSGDRQSARSSRAAVQMNIRTMTVMCIDAATEVQERAQRKPFSRLTEQVHGHCKPDATLTHVAHDREVQQVNDHDDDRISTPGSWRRPTRH